MSDVFHKSTFMARSTGYKYRTLSTNTGEKKHRDSFEDTIFERKLKELRREINSRIQNEVDSIADARDAIRVKFQKIDTKIDSMIELQTTVLGLRGNLLAAENALIGMLNKVSKIEGAVGDSEPSSLQSRKSSFRSQQHTIFEEKEIFESTITHI